MSTDNAPLSSRLRETVSDIRSRAFLPLDRRAGALAFGNPNGFLSTIGATGALTKSRVLSGYDPANGIDPRARELRETGYVRLDESFDEALVDTVQASFTEMIQDESNLLGWDPEEYDATFLKAVGNDLLDHAPEAEQFLTPEIGRIVSDYYRSHFQVRQCWAYRNFHVPDDISEDIYANYWHVDYHSPDHVKLFVNLTDVDEEHGPLHVVSIEDTNRLAKREISWRRNVEGVPNRIVEKEAECETLTGERGSAMLVNTHRVLHRAGVPAAGETRDLFQYVLAPASKPLPYDWYERGLDGVTDAHLLRPFQY